MTEVPYLLPQGVSSRNVLAYKRHIHAQEKRTAEAGAFEKPQRHLEEERTDRERAPQMYLWRASETLPPISSTPIHTDTL